jgi:hypothetical protein
MIGKTGHLLAIVVEDGQLQPCQPAAASNCLQKHTAQYPSAHCMPICLTGNCTTQWLASKQPATVGA